MILERGDMWSAFGKGVFMITTNPIRRNDGAVVMGRGIALETKNRFPDLPYDFGQVLFDRPPNVGRIGIYDGVPIWYFMVKRHWAEPARLDIIRKSVEQLNIWLGKRDSPRVDLNFPGIGNGNLPREEVLPLLLHLPDNIRIWEKDVS